MLIHRRGHRQHDIGRDLPALDLARHFGEIARNEVEPAGLSAGARRRTIEERDMANMVGRLGVEVTVFAHRQDLPQLHVAEATALLGQRGQQCRRLAYPGRNDDEVAVLDLIDRICSGNKLGLVLALDRHVARLPVVSSSHGKAGT